MIPRLILASGSISRIQLLKHVEINFTSIPSDFNESSFIESNPEKRVEGLALAKGQQVREKYPKSNVLSADTIVVYKNKIMEKPKFKMTALKMLQKFSGNIHTVLTGWSLITKKGKVYRGISHTYVTFRHLPLTEIESYVNDHNVIQWAAGYNTQLSKAKSFVQKVEGSLTGLNGLPLEEIIPILRKHKLSG